MGRKMGQKEEGMKEDREKGREGGKEGGREDLLGNNPHPPARFFVMSTVSQVNSSSSLALMRHSGV